MTLQATLFGGQVEVKKKTYTHWKRIKIPSKCTLIPLNSGEESKLEKAFWEFHKNNPSIYKLLVHYARKWRAVRGKDSQMGIGQLFERIRWELAIHTKDSLSFKLNNNHRAYYARLIMDTEPDLKDVFSLRQQRAQATVGPDNKDLPNAEQKY